MAIQASEIIDYVANSLRDTGHTNYPVDELMGYLNRSIRYLALRLAVGWPAGAYSTSLLTIEEYNLVAGQAAYDLPDDVLALLLVSLPAVPDVQPLTPEQFRQGNYGYMIRAGQIHLIPTPTVAVTAGLIIEYMADPEAVSEETDEVPLGKDYRDLLIDLTLVQAKNRQKENANVTAMLYQMTMGPHLMRHAMMNLGTNNWPAPLKRGPA